MEKLNKLISKCKYSVILTINEHRDEYITVEEYFNKYKEIYDIDINEDIGIDVYNKMVELNTIIDLHFYPNTPVGFYTIYHYDLEQALDIALETIK